MERGQALAANAVALHHRPKPDREDYNRRGRFFLDSLRPSPTRRPNRATNRTPWPVAPADPLAANLRR